MLPSSTVENYLKAIYQGQSSLPGDDRLVPMGQVAAALRVAPGTATTMVKALAESGLAAYEPYSGVRLTPAGEKLAGLVLRRHRLVELFLVQVTGMSWAEVHDEAEQLEHVVSERLIERIDECSAIRPTTPMAIRFPTLMAAIASRELDTLLTCPVGTRAGDSHRRPGSGVPALHRETTSNRANPSKSKHVTQRPIRSVCGRMARR
jgi:DtxR family Mn-dependent transcriptional regulator